MTLLSTNRASVARLATLLLYVFLGLGALGIVYAAVTGDDERPEADEALVEYAVGAFHYLHSKSFEEPDMDIMLAGAWDTARREAGVPRSKSRSTLEYASAVREDLRYLIREARTGSPADVVDHYIAGMAAAIGEPHTRYFSSALWNQPDFVTQRPGHGFIAQKEQGGYRVTQVTASSAAELAGLKRGDLFITPTQAPDGALTIRIIRGEPQAQLRYLNKVMIRPTYTPEAIITNQDLDDDIGYLKVRTFGGRYGDFAVEMGRVAKEVHAVSRLVVDLRNNRGGSVQNILQLSVELGYEGLALTTVDRIGFDTEYVADPKKVFSIFLTWRSQPEHLVILINENTASAAEIFAQLARENLDATVIGTTTSGATRASTYVPLGDTYPSGDGGLQVAVWQTLVGNSRIDIDGVGVVPDIIVEQDVEALLRGEDNVLDAAIEFLRGR